MVLQKLKDYFFYTRSERNGLLLLIGILLLLVLSLPFLALIQSKARTDFTEFEEQIQAFHQNLMVQKNKKEATTGSYAQAYVIEMNSASREDWLALGLSQKQVNTLLNYQKKGGYFSQVEDLTKVYGIDKYDLKKIEAYLRIQPRVKVDRPKRPKSSPPPIQLAFFDPNTAEKELLLQVGIPPRVVSTMLNYRDKGGYFRKKKDLLKIFGLTQSTYTQIEPYLLIEPPSKQEAAKTLMSDTLALEEDSLTSPAPEAAIANTKPSVPAIIDINTADQATLESLKGIGPYYSKQIITYREQLGGFNRLEQIKETYNFPDSTFQNIKTKLTLSPIIRQIEINQATAKALSQHPYISWRLAKVIVNYRKMHGPFRQSEELANIRMLDQETRRKIIPYLQFE
ncbi:MAG: helix-hairpin-helix domain-containing protein [Bacteroidota bacterium]